MVQLNLRVLVRTYVYGYSVLMNLELANVSYSYRPQQGCNANGKPCTVKGGVLNLIFNGDYICSQV